MAIGATLSDIYAWGYNGYGELGVGETHSILINIKFI